MLNHRIGPADIEGFICKGEHPAVINYGFDCRVTMGESLRLQQAQSCYSVWIRVVFFQIIVVWGMLLIRKTDI